MPDGALWYVAYGSNLSSVRFQRYLDTCADTTAPTACEATTLSHRLFFAHESARWGGGTAFVDPAADSARSPTLAVAWRITGAQFVHVLGAENGRSSPPLLAADLPGSGAPPVRAVSGRYGLVLAVDSPDDLPAYTFTTGADPLPVPTRPRIAYVDTVVDGLTEHHGLSDEAARAYLAERGGSP